MKRAALRHPKTRRLARELNIPIAQAIGTLALLWDWTGEYCPQGDVGRFGDADIAEACGWAGDAAQFVATLAACGWLDPHPEYRLLIHDWQDHCEQFVTKRLSKSGQPFLQGYPRIATDSLPKPKPKPVAQASSQEPLASAKAISPPTSVGEAMCAQTCAEPCDLPSTTPGGIASAPFPSNTAPPQAPAPPGASFVDAASDMRDVQAEIDRRNACPHDADPDQDKPQPSKLADGNGTHGLPQDVYDALVTGWGNGTMRGLARVWPKALQVVEEAGGDTTLAMRAIANLRARKGRAVDILVEAAAINKAEAEAANRQAESVKPRRRVVADLSQRSPNNE